MQKISVPFSLIFKIGIRYLTSRYNHRILSMSATLSIIGITLSVGTLILVMSVMNGFRIELIEKILGVNAHMSIYQASGNGIKDYKKTANIISKIPHVVSAYPMIDMQGMLINKQEARSSGVLIKGMTAQDIKRKIPLFKIVRGFIDSESNKKGNIIIGHNLAIKLGAYIGKKITLVGPQVSETPFGTMPRFKDYTVQAIISTGMPDYDDVLAFLALSDAQIFYRMKDRVNIIEVNTTSPEMVDSVRNAIERIPELKDLRIIDWRQENHSLMQALKMESNVMLLILTLFILVAMITILVSLTMLVNEKHKNIAVLASMGLNRMHIAGIFFVTGMTIVGSGILLGTIAGTSLASNIDTIRLFLEKHLNTTIFNGAVYLLSTLPSKVQYDEVFTMIIAVFSCGIFTSVVPAVRATKVNPANTLKYF